MLTFDKQIELARIANEAGGIIVGGGLSLFKHGLLSQSEHEELTLYFRSPVNFPKRIKSKVEEAARNRIGKSQPNGSIKSSVLGRLEQEACGLSEIGTDGWVLSCEDSLRSKLENFTHAGRIQPAAEYWDIYQIDEKLGPYGLDGFIAPRSGSIEIEQFRRNLRMTYSNPGVKESIRNYVTRKGVEPEKVLRALGDLEGKRLPIVSATVQMSEARKLKDREAEVRARSNLIQAIERTQGGFTESALRLPPPIERYPPIAEKDSAADDVCREISKYRHRIECSLDVRPGYNVQSVPDYATGLIESGSQIAYAAGLRQSESSTSSVAVQSPTKPQYHAQSGTRGPAL